MTSNALCCTGSRDPVKNLQDSFMPDFELRHLYCTEVLMAQLLGYWSSHSANPLGKLLCSNTQDVVGRLETIIAWHFRAGDGVFIRTDCVSVSSCTVHGQVCVCVPCSHVVSCHVMQYSKIKIEHHLL